jgi:hypothetical protein
MSCELSWEWKQRIAVTRFLIAFKVRRILRFIHLRCGLGAHPGPRQPPNRDYWTANK